MGRLENKVALITGTGGGMGRAAAILFAQEGAKVVGCDLNAEANAETEELARKAGGEMTALGPVDLGDPEAAATWVNEAAATYGGVDVLYNNASAIRMAPIDQLSVEDWQFTLRNELDQVFYVTRAAWPHLVARGGGAIINVGSIAAVRGVEFVAQNAHAAAKAGCMALTLQFVAEGGKHRIRANSVIPGPVVTPATAPVFTSPNPPEAFKRLTLDRIPMGRLGQPEDVAKAALFLASDDAAWISGASIVVDGGLSTLG
ncbi:SDR family NAD(P)-dependent oxidoreductase [Streptomyces sp. NPDC002928]|uniref:SDR family NAD(P)-dependent oxidoreductase n=1 Tax=Streptomyces sp. NPDC002928 TaxID=3154440 RepID=UPI0033BF6EA8